ncbi:twin-arginine translocation signal domain-containing protein, partial [Nocardia brasiliensis]|uniref:twin-arginine translocation signal domain-containing protein n=1 Tax=Nocardia brasiliensis TaxID=37326 RepID=UPI002458D4A9
MTRRDAMKWFGAAGGALAMGAAMPQATPPPTGAAIRVRAIKLLMGAGNIPTRLGGVAGVIIHT